MILTAYHLKDLSHQFILKIIPKFLKKIDWLHLKKNLEQTLCKIATNNPIYIIQPIPELGFNAPQKIIKNSFYGRNEKTSISYDSYLSRSEEIRKIINRSANKCNVEVLDASKILCKNNECISTYRIDLFIVMEIT